MSFSNDPNYRAGSRCFQVVTSASFESFQQAMPHFLPASADYNDQHGSSVPGVCVCVGACAWLVDEEGGICAAVRHEAPTHVSCKPTVTMNQNMSEGQHDNPDGVWIRRRWRVYVIVLKSSCEECL